MGVRFPLWACFEVEARWKTPGEREERFPGVVVCAGGDEVGSLRVCPARTDEVRGPGARGSPFACGPNRLE